MNLTGYYFFGPFLGDVFGDFDDDLSGALAFVSEGASVVGA